MIISKKKFNEAIENAKVEAEKKAYEEFWRRQQIDRLEETTNRRMAILEDRLWKLEHPDSAPSDNSHYGDTVAPGTVTIGY